MDVLENEGPAVSENDTVTTSSGKNLSLAPEIKHKLKTLAEIRQKMAVADCK